MKKFKKRKSEMKTKIILTGVILSLLNMLGSVPTPGINSEYFKSLLPENPGLNVYNLFSGNAMENVSVMMLSITPYITASIILQLMGVVIPELYELQREGTAGQKQFKKISVVLGIVLGFLQALCYAIGYGRQGLLTEYTWYWVLCVTVIWTLAGGMTILAGELITEKGFGNGTSLILLCNILVSYPKDLKTVYEVIIKDDLKTVMCLKAVLSILFIFLLFAFIITVQETEKKIPVKYSGMINGKVRSDRSVVSIKLIAVSVSPVIFASSIMAMPSLILSLAGKDVAAFHFLNSTYWFDKEKWYLSGGILLYILLIFAFTFYYTDLILNPAEIANNLKMNGGMIPGIRPGRPTSEYLEKRIHEAARLGAAALTIVAMVPCLLSGIYGISRISFAGTSILITVSVIMESYDKLQSDHKMKNMKIFNV